MATRNKELTPEQLALVEKLLPYAQRLAKVYAKRSGHDDAELESNAVLALFSAARRYDPDNAACASFQTFAEHRIRGSLLDAMRTERINNGFSRGRAKRGLPQRVYRVAWPLGRDHPTGQHEHTGLWDPPSRAPGPDTQLLLEERRAWALAQVTRARDRRVLALRFLGENQKAIGAMIGVNESRVSQLEKRAVAEAKAAFDLLHPAA